MLTPSLSTPAFRSASGSNLAANPSWQPTNHPERLPVGSARSHATVTPLANPEEWNSFRMLGIHVDNFSMSEAIGTILRAASGNAAASFAFVNADCLNIASNDKAYAAILARQTRVFADGSGIALAARLRGITVRENINGTDMFPLLCAAAAERGLRIFLLGGRPDIAGRAAANMAEEFPDLCIAGTHDGYFDASQEAAVISMINQSGADILLVGLGAPRQEKWIAAHRASLSPKAIMAVGGLFDYYSGRVWRAPVVMRRSGFEWVWRLMQEPARLWRRYILGNPRFLARCLLEQLSEARRVRNVPGLIRNFDRHGRSPQLPELPASTSSVTYVMRGQS